MCIKQGKTDWKLLLVVIILAAIVGGGILYYWNSVRKEISSILQQIPQIQRNTKDETTNWQTYTNIQYGFEIKYPTGWFQNEQQNGAQVVLSDYVLESLPSGYAGPFCSLNIIVSDAVGSPFTNEILNLIETGNGVNGLKIGGVPAVRAQTSEIKLLLTKDKDSVIHSIYFKNQHDYQVVLSGIKNGSSGIQHCSNTFNLILSTFRFIGVDKIADWQTYKNEQYGFEIKYPADTQCGQFSGNGNGNFNFGRIEIGVFNSGGLNLNSFVDKYLSQNSETFNTVDSKKQININAGDAVTVDYRLGGTNRYGEIVFLKNNANIYALGFTAGSFTCNEPQIFSQMLSTFKFLE